MLGFLHQSLIENKHKVMRWKILHYILPCKTLLCQWKLSDTPTCNFCNAFEDYQHYFLTCKYLKNLWEKVYLISEKVGYSRNIYTLKNIIWGYKIKYKEYEDINYFITIILFTIYKVYCVSEQKSKALNVITIFRNEIKNSVFMYRHVKGRKSSILYLIQNLMYTPPPFLPNQSLPSFLQKNL